MASIVRSPLFWVAGLGLVAVVTMMVQVADSPLVRAPLLDESWYLQDAARLEHGGWPGDEPFVMSPGYTWLVAATGAADPLVDRVTTGTPVVLLVVQVVAWLICGLVPGWVVWHLGGEHGLGSWRRRLASAAAAGLMLGYWPAAVYARTVLLDLPLTSLVILGLGVLAVRPRWFVLAALALGMAALLRAHVLILAPLLVLAWRGGRWPARTAAVALLLTPVLTAVAVNSVASGKMVGPSLNAGVNLYLGQQTGPGGLFTSLHGFDQAQDPAGIDYLTLKRGEPVAGPAEADAVWRGEAWRVVRENPGQALRGWLRKTWLHVQAQELSQVTPLGAWRDESPALRWLLVPWWLLVMAGAVGLGQSLLAGGPRIRRVALMVAAAVLGLVAVQSLFFVVSRYRLILAPMLALLAGLGLLSGRPSWRTMVWLLAAGAAVVPWGLRETRHSWEGLEAHNLARRYLVVADHDPDPSLRSRADALLEMACTANPRRWQAWHDRAANLAASGRRSEAMQVLARGTTVADSPRRLEHLRIGLVRDAGRLDQAEALMVSYLADWPDDADMLNDLMVLRGQRGRWSAAGETAQVLIRLAPESHRGWLGLAAAQLRQGQPDQALTTLQRGIEAVGDHEGRAVLQANLQRFQGS